MGEEEKEEEERRKGHKRFFSGLFIEGASAPSEGQGRRTEV